MASLVVRNLPEEAHRALKERAAANGRSMEAEARLILVETVNPPSRVRLGTEIAALADRYGGFDIDVERDKSPIEQAVFE